MLSAAGPHYAVGISFEVDGQQVLAVGDQYQNTNGQSWNYVYANVSTSQTTARRRCISSCRRM